jgi:hypothetical protein
MLLHLNLVSLTRKLLLLPLLKGLGAVASTFIHQ